MNTRLFCASLVLTAVCSGAVQAQNVSPLTPADYIEIQQLLSRLNFALDYCTNAGEDFADLFVDGGEYIIDSGNGEPTVRNTRQALIELAGGPTCESRRTPPSSYIRHLAESVVIEPSAEGARGKSYAIYPANKGNFLNSETAGLFGLYHDVFVRTPDGWRLQSRRHELNPQIG